MSAKKKTGHKALKFVLILLLILAVMTADSTLRVVKREHEVTFADLPSGFDGYKIVQLSDIHGRKYEDYIRFTADAQPDIIVITGDLIDSETDMTFAEPMFNALTALAPVYYITGNHEYADAEFDELTEIMERCGVTFLRNSFTELNSNGDTIVLAGTDDPNGWADMETPQQLFARIRHSCDDVFTIVLNHRNNRLPLFAELGADLVLSGHAHGGIIRLPFTDGLIGPGMELFPEYTSGVYEMDGTVMVVSRGLAGHLRFLNNPEVTVIKLVKG